MEIGAKKFVKMKNVRSSLPRLFWRQFERETALLLHLLLLVQTNKAEQKVAISFTAFVSM